MAAEEKQLHDKAMEDGGRQGEAARGGVFTFFFSWQGQILPSILPSIILPKMGGYFWDFGGYLC